MKNLLLLVSTVLALTACGSDSDSTNTVVNKPDVSKPVVNETVVNKTVVNNPIVSEPDVNKTVVNKPIVNKPEQCSVTANNLNATAVTVTDGDTIKVTDNNGSKYRIRLLGIDAPETKQEYGTQSTETLQACITDAIVNVEWISKDRYGRLLGKVIADGVDCNFEQVKQGSAWHYKAYQESQTPLDQALYANAEIDAHLAVKGLWSDFYAVAPWDYRKGVSSSIVHSNTKLSINNLSDCYGSVSEDTVSASNAHSGNSPNTDNTNSGICSSMIKKTCGQMSSCVEAKQQLSCGNDKIDGNKDGVPCEALCR